MLVIDATNVNQAWKEAKVHLNAHGVSRPSRVGKVMEYPDPVTTKYAHPTERVLFDEKRDANPFFHFMEGLWMLAGRNDMRWITFFNKRMIEFSDDGITQHAAYGHRWRHHFGGDQLPIIVNLLRTNHQERRAVLQMWNPTADLGKQGKDFPCNTAVYFKIRENKLYMTVSNRSNDIVWGCYGANVVHMSMLQEYIASMVGVEVGPYHQVSDSWHAYTEYWEQYGGYDIHRSVYDPYEDGHVQPSPLVRVPHAFDQDLQDWIAEPDSVASYGNQVFAQVATPMFLAYKAQKDKQYRQALSFADDIAASDWRMACMNWLERRAIARDSKPASRPMTNLERKVA